MSTLSIDQHAELRREIESSVRMVAADPICVFLTVWEMLAPEQRAEFLESVHPATEAEPRGNTTMIPGGKACPRRGSIDAQEVESHRFLATNAHSAQAFSAVGHRAFRQALRAVCDAMTLCAGRRPEEVAAEIARRAVAGLRAKLESNDRGTAR
jgi:hypothetical protein